MADARSTMGNRSAIPQPCPEWPNCDDDEGRCYACAQYAAWLDRGSQPETVATLRYVRNSVTRQIVGLEDQIEDSQSHEDVIRDQAAIRALTAVVNTIDELLANREDGFCPICETTEHDFTECPERLYGEEEDR